MTNANAGVKTSGVKNFVVFGVRIVPFLPEYALTQCLRIRLRMVVVLTMALRFRHLLCLRIPD